MNLQNSSSQIHQPPLALHHISPHTLNKTSISLSSNEIPRNSIKQQPKHLTKVILRAPTTNSFWGNVAGYDTIIRLRKTAKFMQNTKTLTDLSFTLKTFLPNDLKYSLSRFQYLQNLSVLDLQITNEKHLTSSSNMKMLYHALASLKNLNRLSLEFPQFSEVPPQLIDSICFALRRLPSLSHLSLKFAREPNLDDLKVKRLASHLKKLSQLKSLVLDFDFCRKINNIGLQPLSETFKNLPLLSDVTLRLLNPKGCSTATISGIFSGLATCKSLKRLDFFVKPDSDCDRNSVDPISLGLNMLNAPSLREIVLKLDPEIKDFGANQLSHALTRFSSLTTLSIDFSRGYYLSDESLSQFSSVLQTLTSLSTLSLSNLTSCKSSQFIEFISQGFGPLIQLKNLSLDFHMSSDQKSTSIKTLSSNLKNLKLLKQLNLNLDSCKFMNDADIGLISEALRELKNLIDLVMHLTNTREETNPGLMSLLSSFSNLPKLHHLTLKLASNSTNDDILKVVARSLQSLPALESLDLAFPSTEALSYDEGLGVLCDSLRNLVSLKKVALEVKKTKEAEEKIGELEKVKLVTMTWNWFWT